jgi:hypothetical protein
MVERLGEKLGVGRLLAVWRGVGGAAFGGMRGSWRKAIWSFGKNEAKKDGFASETTGTVSAPKRVIIEVA